MSDRHAGVGAPSSLPDVLLTTEEAAGYLSVSPSTLAYWRSVGEGPPYARLGIRTIRYRRSEVFAYGDTVLPSGHA